MPKVAFSCENPMPPYAIGHTTSTGPEGLTIIRDSGTLLEVGALLLCKSCLSTTEISAAEPGGQKLFQELAQLRYRESLGDTTGVRVGQNLMINPINGTYTLTTSNLSSTIEVWTINSL